MLTPLLGLSEKEARIAKERELGVYKEHKVGPSLCPGPVSACPPAGALPAP